MADNAIGSHKVNSASNNLTVVVVKLASSNGRVSGKPWKLQKSAMVRSHMPEGVKTKSWQARMNNVKKEQTIRKLQNELSEEKQQELRRRREITQHRKKAAEEKRLLKETQAKMSAKKAARLRRKVGRTNKINH